MLELQPNQVLCGWDLPPRQPACVVLRYTTSLTRIHGLVSLPSRFNMCEVSPYNGQFVETLSFIAIFPLKHHFIDILIYNSVCYLKYLTVEIIEFYICIYLFTKIL
jgi:hypothetical protein